MNEISKYARGQVKLEKNIGGVSMGREGWWLDEGENGNVEQNSLELKQLANCLLP